MRPLSILGMTYNARFACYPAQAGEIVNHSLITTVEPYIRQSNYLGAPRRTDWTLTRLETALFIASMMLMAGGVVWANRPPTEPPTTTALLRAARRPVLDIR